MYKPKRLEKEWPKTDILHIKNIKSLQLTDICLGKLKLYLHPVFHKLMKYDQVLQPKMAANDHVWELLIGDWKFPEDVCMAHSDQKIPGKYICLTVINVPILVRVGFEMVNSWRGA